MLYDASDDLHYDTNGYATMPVKYSQDVVLADVVVLLLAVVVLF